MLCVFGAATITYFAPAQLYSISLNQPRYMLNVVLEHPKHCLIYSTNTPCRTRQTLDHHLPNSIIQELPHHSSSSNDLNLDCRNKRPDIRLHNGRSLEVLNEKESLYSWFKYVPCLSKDLERYSGDSVAKVKYDKGNLYAFLYRAMLSIRLDIMEQCGLSEKPCCFGGDQMILRYLIDV